MRVRESRADYEFGERRYVLTKSAIGDGASFTIAHRQWVRGGRWTEWVEETKDWISGEGHWRTLKSFGPFASRDEASQWMRDLLATSAEAPSSPVGVDASASLSSKNTEMRGGS